MPASHSIALLFPVAHLDIAWCIALAVIFSTLATDSLVLEQLCDFKKLDRITWTGVSWKEPLVDLPYFNPW